MSESTERLLITLATALLFLGFFTWVGVTTYRDYMRTPHRNIYSGKMELGGVEVKTSSVQYKDPEDAFNP